MARAIAEFSSAGCGSERLARNACRTRRWRRRSWRFIARWIANSSSAAWPCAPSDWNSPRARIEREGLGGIRAVYLDGFHALPDPELRVVAALNRHADVTLTLADAD